jgi:hypothetical protein
MREAQIVMNCSFCGEDWKKVSKLIAGPKVFICDGCVDLCGEIVAEQRLIERMKARGEVVIPKSDAERLAWMRTWTTAQPQSDGGRIGEG